MTLFSTLTGISTAIEPTRAVPAWTRPEGVCPAFRWIGQAFTSCDECGQPYWDHTHEEIAAPGSRPFGARFRHVYVPQEKRAKVRAHWTGRIA